jgi:RimJ/RimL family protein N-acetyltransferase
VSFRIEPATDALFAERAAWRYPPPYDFYDDDGVPPLNPERFFSVHEDGGAIAGYYYFDQREDAIFFGLGLRPDLTGRGLGLGFVKAGLDFARERFGPSRFVLDVAEFNERAIRVYERAGFSRTGTKTRFFEGWGDVPFVDMERPID